MPRKSILIVEDDLDIRTMLKRLLEEEGFEVASAENGRVALDMLRKGLHPHLILLDLMMPEMDAVEFRKQQEMNPSISSIPILIMSADGMVDVKSLRLGLNRFVRKPIEIDNLLSSIAKVLDNPR